MIKNLFRKIKIKGGPYYNPSDKSYEFKNYKLVLLNVGDVLDDKGMNTIAKIENEVAVLDECSDIRLYENYYKKTWQNIAESFNKNVVWEIMNDIQRNQN